MINPKIQRSLLDGKGIVNCLNAAVICDLISVNGEFRCIHCDDRITWKPVLAAGCDVILLCGNQLIELGTGSGVCGHVKGSLGIGYCISVHILDGVTLVVFVECIKCCLCFCISIFRI